VNFEAYLHLSNRKCCGWTLFKEKVLKAQEQLSHVPKDELAGKTGLAEQRAVAGTQEKKESLWPLEEGAGHSGGLQGYHEVMQGES